MNISKGIRYLNIKKSIILVQLLPLILSLTIVIGSMGIIAYNQTQSINDQISKPLDIKIDLEGLNISGVEKAMEKVNQTAFQSMKIFSRSQFMLPLNQEVMERSVDNPENYNLSANILATMHCLIIDQETQERLNVDIDENDLVSSSNLLEEFSKEIDEPLGIWTQLLPNLLMGGNITSLYPLIWFNDSITGVFEENNNRIEDYFFSEELFNTSNPVNLGYEYHHFGEEGKAFYLMFSTESLKKMVWVENLTSYSLAFDIK